MGGKEDKFDKYDEMGQLPGGYDVNLARETALQHAREALPKQEVWLVGLSLVWEVETAHFDEDDDCYKVLILCYPKGAEVESKAQWEYHIDATGKLYSGTPILRSKGKWVVDLSKSVEEEKQRKEKEQKKELVDPVHEEVKIRGKLVPIAVGSVMAIALIVTGAFLLSNGSGDKDGDVTEVPVTVTPALSEGSMITVEPTPIPTPTPTSTFTPTLSNPVVVMKTNYGDITIELFEDKVPVTVDNFVRLAQDGFYDGMIFHRISDDFMIQSGLEMADGTMKQSPYGPINLEIHPEVRHVDGAISMARTNDPNSATAQFFICDSPQPFLDDGYAAFGTVTEGIEVIREIAARPHDNSNPAGGGVPLSTILIDSIELKE